METKKDEYSGTELQEKYGISDDFVVLNNICEAMVRIVDALYQGVPVPEDLIDEAVRAFGDTIGYITAKYDPNLNGE